MIQNPIFRSPPASLMTLSTALISFDDACATQAPGRKVVRGEIINLLRRLAKYVEDTANTLTELLSSGFEEDTNEPQITLVEDGPSSQVIINMQAVRDATSYEVRASSEPSEWLPIQVFYTPRGMILTSLTPKTIYTIQVRAVRNSTNFTNWSEPASHLTR